MKHAGTQRIETDRLIIRRFELNDAEMMFRNWTNDSIVTRYMRWQAHETVETTKEVLQHWVDGYKDNNCYHWGICFKEGEIIGSIGIFVTSEHDFSAEAGYCIGRKWWSQGVVSEALKAVLNYMFTHTDIERIGAYHAVENPASGRVMEKAGMKFEGLVKHQFRNNYGFYDCNLYGIIRKMWEK